MAKFGVVLVSHSEYIAKGLKELVDEMNDGSVQVVAAGGADGLCGSKVPRVLQPW